MENNYDEIDNLFIEYFNNDKEIPIMITNGIKTAMYMDRKKYNLIELIKKIIIIVIEILLFTGGIVFAGLVINNIFKYNQGIEQAVENNYIQNIDMNYIVTEDLEFKVDHLVMDDINFALVFDFKVKDKVENYQGIALHNLKIRDDLGNQILYDTEGDEFYNNKALIHSSWEIIEKENHNIKQILKAQAKDFPRSNTIYIEFDGITLHKVEKGETTTKTYQQKWNLSFDVSNQLKEREIQELLADNNNIKNIKLTNSGLVLEIKSNSYLENIILKDDEGNKYNKTYITQNRNANLKQYIENEWIVFFDANVYNNAEYYILNIGNEQYRLNKINNK